MDQLSFFLRMVHWNVAFSAHTFVPTYDQYQSCSYNVNQLKSNDAASFWTCVVTHLCYEDGQVADDASSATSASYLSSTIVAPPKIIFLFVP